MSHPSAMMTNRTTRPSPSEPHKEAQYEAHSFETLCSIAASMPGRWRRIFRPSSTKAGMRQRAAQENHSSSIVRDHALVPDRETELLFEEVGAIEGSVRFRDLGEFPSLAARQILRVLPQREARPFRSRACKRR